MCDLICDSNKSIFSKITPRFVNIYIGFNNDNQYQLRILEWIQVKFLVHQGRRSQCPSMILHYKELGGRAIVNLGVER